MCYNGLSSRATDLVPARHFMPRRHAVPLTSPRSISNSALFPALSREGCIFCTLVQKSEAHPLTFQLLPVSLQKHRGWHQERTSKTYDVETFRRSNMQTLFKSFRINTCKSVSKQRTLTAFRMNTYAKTEGGGSPGFTSSACPSIPTDHGSRNTSHVSMSVQHVVPRDGEA